MIHFLRALTVLVALSATTLGQQQLKPEVAGAVSDFLVDVSGPDAIPAGDLAVFEVGKSTATKFAWTIIPSNKNFRVDSSLRLAYLSGSAGTFTLVLVGTDTNGNVAIDTQTVVIGGKPTIPPVVVPPGPVGPPPIDTPPLTTKVTGATFIYEKDSHVVPKAVLSALNKLNREKKILATIMEADTTDGTGQVPEQYKVALAAAKQKGLPCLVVTAGGGSFGPGDKVLTIVPNPKTEADVLKAVP